MQGARTDTYAPNVPPYVAGALPAAGAPAVVPLPQAQAATSALVYLPGAVAQEPANAPGLLRFIPPDGPQTMRQGAPPRPRSTGRNSPFSVGMLLNRYQVCLLRHIRCAVTVVGLLRNDVSYFRSMEPLYQRTWKTQRPAGLNDGVPRRRRRPSETPGVGDEAPAGKRRATRVLS